MARPQKIGLSYFSHDVDASNDEKIETLRSLYGNDGYAFYFICLERIYRTESGELDVSDAETTQILRKKCGINSEETFQKMLNTAIKYGCFDKNEYETRHVLTSNGIKKRIGMVVGKREKQRELYENRVSDAETTQETMSETPQTKQNKTKLNKRKEDNTAKKFIPPVVEEVSKYCSDRKNNVDAETFIAHYASKGWMIGNSKMKDWKSAIITWEKRNKKSANEKLLEEKGESFFDGFR